MLDMLHFCTKYFIPQVNLRGGVHKDVWVVAVGWAVNKIRVCSNNYLTLSCLSAKSHWLISHV